MLAAMHSHGKPTQLISIILADYTIFLRQRGQVPIVLDWHLSLVFLLALLHQLEQEH